MNADRRLRRSPFAKAMLALVGIALFFGFVALGTWQVQRLSWKLALIERVEQRVHASPVALPAQADWAHLDARVVEYQAVQAMGHWLAKKTVLTQAATELGSGFWVITPLQLGANATTNDGQVLVNRGFIPDSQRLAWSDPAYAVSHTPTGTVSVTGLLRLSEPHGGFLRHNDPAQQRWYSRDVVAIAQAVGLNAFAPFFLDEGIPSKAQLPALLSPTASDMPRSGMTTISFHNNHLVYALTWYSLAAMVVGAAWLVVRHDKKNK